MIVYPRYIRNRSQWNVIWRDNQPHGYSRPILFPHSAKRVRDCRQNHHDCRQNIPWLLWNALLTTPYVSEHYKYTFLVARGLYEMFVLYRGKHTTATVGIWSMSILYAGHVYTVGRRPIRGQVSRQPALDVLIDVMKYCRSTAMKYLIYKHSTFWNTALFKTQSYLKTQHTKLFVRCRTQQCCNGHNHI